MKSLPTVGFYPVTFDGSRILIRGECWVKRKTGNRGLWISLLTGRQSYLWSEN